MPRTPPRAVNSGDDRQDGDPADDCRFAQRPVEGGERKLSPHCEFEVSGIVDGQTMCIRKGERLVPGEGVRIGVDLDVQIFQRLEKAAPLHRRDPALADCGLKAVRNLERPQRRHRCAVGFNAGHDQFDRRRPLVFIEPRQRYRAIEDEAQRRPSSIKSRIVKSSPNVTPLLSSRILSMARRRFSRTASGDVAETSLATGLPRRVITTSSPCSTRSSNALNVFLAS